MIYFVICSILYKEYIGGNMEDQQVRNFYEEESEYEKTTEIIKDLIEKIVRVDINIQKQKLEFLNIYEKYNEFEDLLTAVLGKDTNKYYYAQTEEDVKYYNLELGKVYNIEDVNIEIQTKNNKPNVLKLEARSILAEKLLVLAKEIKKIFEENIHKGDGSFATIDSSIIKESDIEYYDNLILYLEKMMDKTGRLKILVAEQDVYKKIKEEEEFNKKGALGKFFSKLIK